MSGRVEILEVELASAPVDRAAVEEFYGERLGLARLGGVDGVTRFAVGAASLSFRDGSAGERPFYHFALLVPGNRFDAARRWGSSAAPLLPYEGETRLRFDDWDADACYFLDPAGNIVELIAHHGVAESVATGSFDVSEVRGVSEIGIVVTAPVEAIALLERAGLPLWSGDARARGEVFAFVGRKAHTAILTSPGHPWLPTGRPAEVHPLTTSIRVADDRTCALAVTSGRLTVA
jgi:hypothetical protein